VVFPGVVAPDPGVLLRIFSDFSFGRPLSGAEEESELSPRIEEAVDVPSEAMLESCSRWLLIKV
jgi:hypothetical protein